MLTGSSSHESMQQLLSTSLNNLSLSLAVTIE